jgi:hypothetical protein
LFSSVIILLILILILLFIIIIIIAIATRRPRLHSHQSDAPQYINMLVSAGLEQMWGPQRLTTLWALTTCYRDNLTFLAYQGKPQKSPSQYPISGAIISNPRPTKYEAHQPLSQVRKGG